MIKRHDRIREVKQIIRVDPVGFTFADMQKMEVDSELQDWFNATHNPVAGDYLVCTEIGNGDGDSIAHAISAETWEWLEPLIPSTAYMPI